MDNNNKSLVPSELSDAPMVARKEFGGDQLTSVKETASMAVAATQRAVVEARYTMALHRPRDLLQTREKMLEACARPGFARTARYAKPVGGGKIEGWSIRFAEEAIRCMGNLLPETSTIYDDAKMRIVKVTLTDLETNIAYSKDVSIQKTVERSSNRGEVLGQRIGSNGQTVYIIRATDDDLSNKENALVSKALRNHALRLVPGDVLEDCLDKVMATMRGERSKNPAEFRKGIVDGFARLNVATAQLADYLGHAVDKATLDELEELRLLGIAIKDGETTWAETMRQRADARKAETGEAPASGNAEAAPKTTADLKARAKKSPAKKKEEPAPEVKAETPPIDGMPVFEDDEPEPPVPPDDASGDLFK
jgi:hypothetical protein